MVTKILIPWPIFHFFHADLKAIKPFEPVKKFKLYYISFTAFAEIHVKVDADWATPVQPKETGGNYLSHVHPNGSVMINNLREL